MKISTLKCVPGVKLVGVDKACVQVWVPAEPVVEGKDGDRQQYNSVKPDVKI